MHGSRPKGRGALWVIKSHLVWLSSLDVVRVASSALPSFCSIDRAPSGSIDHRRLGEMEQDQQVIIIDGRGLLFC